MAEPTVSAGVAKALLAFGVSRGASEAALARRAAIDPENLENHDNRVPFAAYMALMRAAMDLCNDPALPLHFGEALDLSEFSIVGLLTRASATMMDALAQLNRYGQLVVEVDIGAAGRFSLERKNGGIWLVDTRKDPNAYPELTESTFARMICGPRRFLPRPNVLEVHVTHAPPAHSAEYDRIFQCPVTFASDRNALLMDPELLHHTVAQEPRFVFGVLSAHADALLASLESLKTARGRVESLLLPILHTGDIGMDVIAGKMDVSRRTLHRMLQAEGVTFERVLDELRHKMALDYLSGKKVSVNETAYLVGFSEPAAFSRAFKRWTGTTPRAARSPKKISVANTINLAIRDRIPMMARSSASPTKIVTGRQAIAFIRKHGVALESSRGKVASFAEAVAGAPINGNWWSHPKGREIFALTRIVRDCDDVLVCRVADGKVTFVHRRLWPALIRLADRFPRERLAQLREEHTPSGRHIVRTTAFPDWVSREVSVLAGKLREAEALAQMGPLLM